MGLFINSDKHPDVFKNNGQIIESNQAFFKKDHTADLMKEQQKANETLQKSLSELKNLYHKQANRQTRQFKHLHNGISEQKKLNFQHEKVDNQVLSWLEKLDEKNSTLQMTLKDEVVLKQEMMNYMDTLNHSNSEVVNKLDKYGLANEQLELKVDDQLEMQSQLSLQLTKQADTQLDVLNRLENQEALNEKILRQIDYFRATLFERTNYLAEKIDTGYNYAVSYVSKLMTSSDQMPKQYVITKEKDNKKNLQ
ncbi:MAG TPA: hypothetical protein VLQ66_05525 [Paenisporosarcina sp.]|nr:hypothetical protein [Paenisporosarcina sp.]